MQFGQSITEVKDHLGIRKEFADEAARSCINSKSYLSSLMSSNCGSKNHVWPFITIDGNMYAHKVNSANAIVQLEVASMVTCSGNVRLNKGTIFKPRKIFLGYGSCEDLVYEVCRYYNFKRSSIHVELVPIKPYEFIKKSDPRHFGLYWGEQGKLERIEFFYTRILTPYLPTKTVNAQFTKYNLEPGSLETYVLLV